MPQTWQIIVFQNKTDDLKQCFGVKQCLIYYYLKKINSKMMHDEN